TRLRYGQLWSRMNADEKKQAFNALPDDVKTSAADKINNRWNPSPEKQAQMLARAKKSASKNAVQPPKAPAHPTKPQAAPAKTDAPASDTTPPAWDEPR
ncbi:MAG: hypothetical protein EBZ69_09785, partial [Alphaproteobacteria bacterium]|nr:hypothetical protein [Alphaproteobacteria bacterium]